MSKQNHGQKADYGLTAAVVNATIEVHATP